MSDDIIKMAREAGLPTAWISESGIVQWAQLERLIALVRADEREACAMIADSLDPLQDGAIGVAIRARGNT